MTKSFLAYVMNKANVKTLKDIEEFMDDWDGNWSFHGGILWVDGFGEAYLGPNNFWSEVYDNCTRCGTELIGNERTVGLCEKCRRWLFLEKD
ncbi:MAG: hypothetical protein ACTSUO_05990 [Candidatus Thorarchaeota archaeon]